MGEVLEDCRKANVTPIFKNVKAEDPGKNQLHLNPWEGDEITNYRKHFLAHEGQESYQNVWLGR